MGFRWHTIARLHVATGCLQTRADGSEKRPSATGCQCPMVVVLDLDLTFLIVAQTKNRLTDKMCRDPPMLPFTFDRLWTSNTLP